MPVQSVINQYRGINAHLHSRWQAEGGWSHFHTRHIVHLADMLKAKLLPMGYVAEVEESLQIRRITDTSSFPKADILVSDADTRRHFQPTTLTPAVVEEVMVFADLLSNEELSDRPYRAVAVYERKATQPSKNEPLVWIELLSPTNKGDSEDAKTYRTKRLDVLVNGIVFLEIDYLHETPPTFPTIPLYRADHKANWSLRAHPYRFILIDPRPILEQGPTRLVSFDVDQAIPTVTIPLNAGDKVEFDFGVPYRKTFEEGLYGYDVDYSQFPAHFDRYSPADQARIANRMLAILEAAQNGLDLETGPFPSKDLSLEEALAQLKALTSI